jgi:hypothetical protein
MVKTTNFLKILLLTSLVIGCSSDVVDLQEGSGIDGQGRLQNTAQSTFVVEQATLLNRSLHSDNSELWSDIPTQSLMEIQVCLRDVARANPIIDRPFILTTPFGEITRYTQTNGCLNWTEMIEFSFLSDERYLEYPVRIVGPANYPGVQNLSLALNPWPNSERPLVDLHYQNLLYPRHERAALRSVTKQSTLEQGLRSSLRIDGLSLQLTNRELKPDQQAVALTYEIEARVRTLRANIQQTLTSQDLTRGRFSLNIVLIERDRDEQVNFQIAQLRKEVQLRSGTLKETLIFNVDRASMPKLTSNIEAFIELSPIAPPPGLTALKGIVDMQGLERLQSNELIHLSDRINQLGIMNESDDENNFLPNQRVELRHYLSQRDSKRDGEDDTTLGIILDRLTMTPGSIINEDARTSSKRVMRVHVQGCFRAPLSQGPLRNSTFRLQSTQSGHSELNTDDGFRTDTNGCFRTHLTLGYDAFDRERWIALHLRFVGLDSEARGSLIHREIRCNPWNSSDFCYDLGHQNEPLAIDGPGPKLAVNQVSVSAEGKALTSFRLNRFLQLSLKKSYTLKFNPLIEFMQGHRDATPQQALTFGQYAVTAIVLTPNEAETNWLNPDLDRFQFLTAVQQDFELGPSGEAQVEISLPFYFTEIHHLNKRNLLVLKLESRSNPNVKPAYVSVPFLGTHANSLFSTARLNEETASQLYDSEWSTSLNHLLTKGHKGVEPTEELLMLPQIELYREQLATKEAKEVKGLTLTELNQLPSLGQSARTRNNLEQDISRGEFRVLSNEGGVMPNTLLRKFCRHYFPPPRNGRGGQAFQECYDNPTQHLESVALIHVEEILSRQNGFNKHGEPIRFGTATLVDEEYGEISHGTGFFAAYGDRAHDLTGEQNVTAFTRGAELFLHAPAPLLMTFNSGVSQAYETVTQRASADMQMTFDRRYRQIGYTKLEYNMIKLAFTARVHSCVAVKSRREVTFLLHVCQDEDSLRRLEEEWFFIGRNDPERHSLLTDGSRLHNNELTQLIRGRYHFQRLWDQYKAQDTVMVIRELAGRELYTPLIKFKERAEDKRFMEAYQDNNFPGLMTPSSF